MIRRLLLIGAIALTCGGLVRIALQPVPAKAVAPHVFGITTLPQANGFWVPQWTRPVPACRDLDFAGDGNIAWVDAVGSVRRMDTTGKTVWQTKPLRGVRAVSAVSGGAVLAYSLLNPAFSTLTILPPKWGDAHKNMVPLGGAIWSVAAGDGSDRAFVGTSDGLIRAIPLGAGGAMKQQRVSGIPEQLCVDDKGRVAASLWLGSGVAFLQVPQLFWSLPEEQPARRARLALSGNGKTLVSASGVGSAERDGRITVWEPQSKKLLWTRDLNGFAPRVMVSEDGETIAVGYQAVQMYRTGAMVERRLLLFNRGGQQISVPLGGAFFMPTLISLSRDGQQVVVRDERGMIYTLRRDGGFVSRLRPLLGASKPLQDVQTDRDGRMLLVRQGDQITLYRAAR